LKTLFFGTPALAVPYLELLAKQTELRAVVTTPDEPAGRGYELQPTPVKQAAKLLNLPVLQPASLKDPSIVTQLAAYEPDVVIVVAYGKILPRAVLDVPRQGFINVHFSLLPAYRGAAPIQRALINGDIETGVTLFWLDEGMDTGPIFLKKSLSIQENDDADSLREKLIPLGVETLQNVLDALAKGNAVRLPQVGTVSLAPPLKKEEGKLDWAKPAKSLLNLIRGTTPWPGAYSFLKSGDKPLRLKVLKAQVVPGTSGADSSSEAGSVVRVEKGSGFVVKCGQDFLLIRHVQPEGKRPMSAWDFWQGARLKQGDKLE
jgi:methionyl-tRNA formyltransferase